MKKQIIFQFQKKTILMSFLIFFLLSSSVIMAQTNPCFDVQTSVTHVTGCNNGSIAITVTNFELPIMYKIYKTGETPPADWTEGSPNFTLDGLCGGQYQLKIIDNSQCPAVCPVITINGPDCLEVEIEDECDWEVGGCNGPWTVDGVATGGTTPYTYCWTDEQSNTVSTTSRLNASQAGTYRLTVTDANGCIASDLVYVGPLEVEPLVITDASCNSNGSVAVSLKGGWYWCNICSTPVFQFTMMKLDPSTGAFIPFDGNELPEINPDYISLSINPMSNWNSQLPNKFVARVKRSFTISNLPPGKYRFDILGVHCSETVDFEIKDNSPIAISGNVSQDCNNPNSGSIVVTASGGVEPYTYAWKKDGVLMNG